MWEGLHLPVCGADPDGSQQLSDLIVPLSAWAALEHPLNQVEGEGAAAPLVSAEHGDDPGRSFPRSAPLRLRDDDFVGGHTAVSQQPDDGSAGYPCDSSGRIFCVLLRQTINHRQDARDRHRSGIGRCGFRLAHRSPLDKDLTITMRLAKARGLSSLSLGWVDLLPGAVDTT